MGKTVFPSAQSWCITSMERATVQNEPQKQYPIIKNQNLSFKNKV
jgi:hypothetical protein